MIGTFDIESEITKIKLNCSLLSCFFIYNLEMLMSRGDSR